MSAAQGPGPAAPESRRAVVAAWLIALAGSLALVLMTLAAPFLRPRSPRFSALLYAVFAPLCHQDPARCFSLAGYPVAVCGRCLGIDLGFVLGALVYPFIRGFSRPHPPAVRSFFLASLPIVLDVAGNVSGLWSTPIGARFAVGLLWGSVLPAYFIAGVRELLGRLPGLRPPASRPPAV
jgi:uncharacterized membrane protein